MIKSLKVAVFLALKSIVRGNIGIIVLTVFMLVLVTMNLLFVPGLISGATISMNTILITTYSGDIIIEPAGDDHVITHVNDLIKSIDSIDGVVAASARSDINAYFTYEDRRMGRVVTGIDPVADREVFNIANNLIEGSYLDSRDRGEILLGIQLAGADHKDAELYSSSLRHVHAGDKIKVTYSNGVEKQYTVKGIFDSGFVQTDLQAFVTKLEFDSVVPNMYDRATSVRVRLEDSVNSYSIIDRIASLRNDIEFQTWQQTAGLVQSFAESFALIDKILNVVNYLVAGITVFIVTYVDVINRRRQIGLSYRPVGFQVRDNTRGNQASLRVSFRSGLSSHTTLLYRAHGFGVIGCFVGGGIYTRMARHEDKNPRRHLGVTLVRITFNSDLVTRLRMPQVIHPYLMILTTP
jgi:putative ABC transport system permease protein